jgi:hypothetical protein
MESKLAANKVAPKKRHSILKTSHPGEEQHHVEGVTFDEEGIAEWDKTRGTR